LTPKEEDQKKVSRQFCRRWNCLFFYVIMYSTEFKKLKSFMSKKGFTLIELLIVIAIIGLLATIVIVVYGTAKSASRDTKRLADLRQIGTALELYNNDENHYPIGDDVALGNTDTACLNSDGWQATGCVGAYMGKVPKDPQSGNYIYSSTSGTNYYTITATLEGTSNGLTGNIRLTPNGIEQGE